MKKERLFVAVAVSMLLSACGSSNDAAPAPAPAPAPSPAPQAPGERIELELATVSVPGDPHTEAMYEFARLIDERSGGRITATVYDSGSLMDQNTEQTAIITGDVDMIFVAAPWVIGQIPELGALFVPFLFVDEEHLFRVHDGPIGDEIRQLVVDRLGIRPLTSVFKGSRELNLKARVGRIMTPDDMAGVNLRVPGAESWLEMGRALGANPTPIAFGELYLALQTGTVDGQDNPLITTWNAKFFEVTDQIVLTSHIIDDVWPTINEAKWQSLDADAQDIILQAWLDAREVATRITLDSDAQLRADLEAAGLEIYTPDRAAFRERALAHYLDNPALSGGWKPGLFEAIRDLATG